MYRVTYNMQDMVNTLFGMGPLLQVYSLCICIGLCMYNGPVFYLMLWFSNIEVTNYF